jgi:hypothetical protein
MKLRKLKLPIVALFAVLFGFSTAHAVMEVEGRYWFTNLDSSFKSSSTSIIGTEIDLVNDLGIDDKKNFWEGRVSLNLGSSKLRYAYMPLSWSGSKDLTKSVVFAGKTYSASTKVDTELDIKYHRLGYEYDIIDTLGNKFGVIFDVKYFVIDASVKADALGFNESESVKAPVPTIGLAAQVALPFSFNVGAEATGITLGKGKYLFDGEVTVSVQPASFLAASVSYRMLKLHLEDGDDMGEIKLKGPYMMLRAGF